MRIDVDIDEVEIDNDDGIAVDSVMATCSRCGHETESFGTSDKSRNRLSSAPA